MTQPDGNGGHDFSHLNPKELIIYMLEMLSRLERVGDRLEAYTDPSAKPTLIPLDPLLKDDDT